MSSSSFLQTQPQQSIPLTVNNSANNLFNQNQNATIMEKDKQIISLSKTTKELSQQIETMNNQIQSKQYEIISLQTEIASLKSDQNIYENKIAQLTSQINALSQDCNVNTEKIESEKTTNQNQLQQMAEAFNTQIKDYENISYQYECLQKENLRLNQEISNANESIQMFQNMIFELKRDNKKVFILNKTIKEKDDVINSLNNNNEILKQNYNAVIKENNELLIKMNSLSKSNEQLEILHGAGSNTIINNTLSQMKLNYKTQIEQKEKEYNDLKKNYDNAIKDNNNLIMFIIDQIKFMEINIDNNNNVQNNGIHIENKSCFYVPKYNLIKKNFEILTLKTIEQINLYQKNYRILQDLYENEKNKTHKIRQQIEMKQNIINQNDNAIKSFDDIIHAKQIEINEINNKLNILIKTNDNLYQENSSLKEECIKYQKSISSYIEKTINTISQITQVPSKQQNITDNTNSHNNHDLNEIPFINLDNYLTQLQSHFNEESNSIKNKIEELEKEITRLENENAQIKSELNSDKLVQDKNDLNTKLQELSEVLKESNKLLDECNKENTSLKEQNVILEHNLQNLNKEKEDLQETINFFRNQNFNEKILEIEQQLNQAKKELEFKTIQTKALETIVKQLKNKDKYKYQKNNHKKLITEASTTLAKDDFKEKEMNDILNKYSYDMHLNQMGHNYLNTNNSFESLNLNPSSSQMLHSLHSPLDDNI